MLRWLLRTLTAFGACGLLAGCAWWREPIGQPTTGLGNPVVIPTNDLDQVWDTLVDVVDDDFEIQREQRPRLVGDALTEGRLETRPLIGSTLLEPWRCDSYGTPERLESTFQTIRRRAIAQVAPAAGGYQVQVTVLKELENLRSPEFATTSSALFSNDNSLRRFSEPVDALPLERGWIPLGNDLTLEQRLLAKLLARLGL